MLVLSWVSLNTAQAACPADINNLAPGTWCEVANSHMRDVAYKWPAGVKYTLNGIGVEGVIDLWSGGAYDTQLDRLMVWGGGHNGYGGNEVYAFDVGLMKWIRLSDPSLVLSTGTEYYADGTPAARHTYNGLQYSPLTNSMLSFNSGQWGVDGSYSSAVDVFNIVSGKWQKFSNRPPVSSYTQSAVDPVTGHMWVKGNADNCYVAELNPVNGDWSTRTNWLGCYSYYATLEVDPFNRVLVGIGDGDQWVMDISANGTIPLQTLNTSGDQTIVNAEAPGLAYDSVSGKLVGWAGGTSVYALDTKTWTWTRIYPSPGNTVSPTAPNSTGTYGRFRYIPSKNAFIVVNSVDENVFFYKLSAGQGTTPPQAPAKPSVTIR